MDQPRPTDEQVLDSFKQADERRARVGYRPKAEPPRPWSALSQRVDKKGVLRWFHATKGWREPVKQRLA